MKYLLVAAIAIACAPPVAAAQGQTAREIHGPPAVVPLTVEQPPHVSSSIRRFRAHSPKARSLSSIG
jgi:hypothetical protein